MIHYNDLLAAREQGVYLILLRPFLAYLPRNATTLLPSGKQLFTDNEVWVRKQLESNGIHIIKEVDLWQEESSGTPSTGLPSVDKPSS